MYASIAGKRQYTKQVVIPLADICILPLDDAGPPAPYAWEISRSVG